MRPVYWLPDAPRVAPANRAADPPRWPHPRRTLGGDRPAWSIGRRRAAPDCSTERRPCSPRRPKPYGGGGCWADYDHDALSFEYTPSPAEIKRRASPNQRGLIAKHGCVSAPNG